MKSVDVMVDHATVMTMNPKREIINDGFIVIKGNEIIDIGPHEENQDSYKAEIIIDAKGNPILPGFVNTHHHFFSTYFRGSPYMHGEGTLDDFLRNIYSMGLTNASQEECYLAVLLGCIEMVRSGITCAIDNNGWISLEPVIAALDAFQDLGFRGTASRLITDRDLMGTGLPISEDPRRAEEETIGLIEKWKEDELQRVWFHPTYHPHCSDELFARLARAAQEHDAGLAIHFHEEQINVSDWVEKTGLSPIQYYQKKGVDILNERTIAAHCVWVDDKDIEILRKTGTGVSHNAVCNLYSAGIAPVPKMLAAGVTVGLGTDDAFGDMFELMKTTAMIHKLPSKDPGAISADKILEMATIDGAKVMGLDDIVGSIEIGKRADLVILDLKHANTTPVTNPLSYLIVYCGKPHNVDTVLINGVPVLIEGNVMTVDEAEVIEKTQKAMDRINLT
jgi:5-methylthioadenosine/S-adenosylhomocysteine deaminase